MRSSRKSVTIYDVAEAAGVSVSTVSRVLNKKDDVAADTFERVQGVIDDLGYTSSLAAKVMRSKRTNVIGVIMQGAADPYSYALLQGVSRAMTQYDHDLIIYTGGRQGDLAYRESYYVALLNGNITDGVIVVTPAAKNFPTTAPVVAVDPNNESPDCPGIISTNRIGAMGALQYLIGIGHRRIGCITGRMELVSGIRRLQGYKAALKAAGIPVDEELIQIGDYTTPTAVRCTHKLLSLDNPPTAIFAANDMSALGVYQAAEESGVSIPGDLSVIGFDNIREAATAKPPLTTVDQFIPEMGEIAVEMLMKLIKGETLECNLHKIQTELVIRDSCRVLR